MSLDTEIRGQVVSSSAATSERLFINLTKSVREFSVILEYLVGLPQICPGS
jgi:hypothetical protein